MLLNLQTETEKFQEQGGEMLSTLQQTRRRGGRSVGSKRVGPAAWALIWFLEPKWALLEEESDLLLAGR